MSELTAEIQRVLGKLTPAEQAQVKSRLGELLLWRKAVARFPSPAHLAAFHRNGNIETPMLQAVDKAILAAESGEHKYWVINTPPQEGKTTRLQDAAAWMLLRNPTLRIAFASYEQGVASQSGLAIRQLIETHGGGYRGQANVDRENVLGLTLDPDRAKQTSWSLASVPGKKNARPGGVISVGIGSALTGKPVDVLIIDDPLKDAKQADSPVYRQAVKDWFQSVAQTRLSPIGIVIVIQTRWHEDDLTGWLLAEDKKSAFPRWRHLNIAAQAKADDPLGRRPGEYLNSARQRTKAQWEAIKRAVGTRWWFAMYQGDPSPPEGGVFKREWFEKNRVAAAPEMKIVLTVVDPADNTSAGDEAGIMTGGIGVDGEYYVLADDSGHYTVAQWFRVALFAMLENRSQKILYEKSLSDIPRRIRSAWKIIREQALALARAQEQWSRFGVDDWPEKPTLPAVSDAFEVLVGEDDTKEERAELHQELIKIWPYVERILRLPKSGPPIKPIIAKGSKTLRAELVSPNYENGEVHHVGVLEKYEHQMATWLVTQDSPDRMDSGVHLINELTKISGTSSIQRPEGAQVPRKQVREIPQILRSTRTM